MTTIGIIGAGKIGAAIATALSRKGIEVTMSNSRGAESLRELTAAIGPLVKPGTREEAASKEIVFVAVPWSKLPAALDGLPNFEGRVVVDTNNPIEAPLFKSIDLGTRASSEVVADLVPGARVVKGFNHLQPHLLSGDPSSEGGKRVLFYSGDDLAAKYVVGTLIERLGFFGIDLGSLAIGARLVQFPGGPLPSLNLVKFD
ncbi:NAD(P)-binding domain-containing protein [Burkholderia cenocepacia]|uniref:NADPH-dependent F420 reductase n=1 Tax=Burkholderia cepacia complex TaxID=87882 RepID=UPI001BA27624|nr:MULTISPECIES: NAD(P)-binding domain-containing protein [Burkholderia cepacia complex]MBR8041234.1 NAD(P)-binding domain-containing protein [Burkholderia cenocepacia]MBR8328911.1 NAD(P)-binding domain-containing protein [Burkholderia cenocepacia]MDN7582387.1 NAD(P)-binding domain-containing protein [Burkholderia orbicola]